MYRRRILRHSFVFSYVSNVLQKLKTDISTRFQNIFTKKKKKKPSIGRLIFTLKTKKIITRTRKKSKRSTTSPWTSLFFDTFSHRPRFGERARLKGCVDFAVCELIKRIEKKSVLLKFLLKKNPLRSSFI